MNFFRGISTVCFTPKNTCTCMHTIQDVYGHVSIRSRPGRLHGRGRLHGSNVLTYCTWARTRRVSAILDGRYFGLLRYSRMTGSHSTMGVNLLCDTGVLSTLHQSHRTTVNAVRRTYAP